MRHALLRRHRVRHGTGSPLLTATTLLVLIFGTLLSTASTPVGAAQATPATGSANLTVNLLTCPAGYDLSSAGANPTVDCTQTTNGVTFTINGQVSGYFSQENTGDSVDSAVYFGGVPVDSYSIEETLPAGIAQAGSLGCDGGSSVTLGNSVVATLNDGDNLTCTFFNAPAAATTPTVAPTASPTVESGNGDVAVYKFVCPAGYDETAPGANPQVDCGLPVNGVTFVLQQTDSVPMPYFSQSNTGDSTNGAVTFGGAPAGNYTITETPPTGLDHAFVSYCAIQTTGLPATTQPAIVNNAITIHLTDQEKWSCYWYNVPKAPTASPTATATMNASPTPSPTMSGTPESGNGDIFVYKFVCPKGYDETAILANPAADCATPEDHVTFVLQQQGGTMPYFSQSDTGDSIPGAVMFGGAPAGDYTITETPPTGLDHAFVLRCDVENGGNTTTFTPALTNYQISLHLHDKDKITCYWYNVYTPKGDVEIYKYYCTTATYVDPNSCTLDPAGGVSFELYRQDGANWVYVTTVTTGANGGSAEAALIPAGTYKLIEVGMTPCQVTGYYKQPDSGNNVPIPDPATTFPVAPDKMDTETTFLNVYNCTGGYGDITVYKWTCPPGYDYTMPGADPKVDCKQATNGVTFVLQQTDSVPTPYFSQSNTGDSIDGAVTFGGAPAGTYTVTETVPSGITSEFVWDCTGASTSWVNPIPLSTGNVLDLKVHNADKIVCNWYNVPAPDPKSGDLTIHKYLCTGTKFTSPVDCFTYENGATFDIATGGSKLTTQTTNAFGVIALSGLTPGNYTVTETSGTPCYTSAGQLDANGNTVNAKNADGSVKVTNGRETVVNVYNCSDPGKKPPPTVPVKKFPNTGVNPAAARQNLAGQDTEVIDPAATATVASTATAAVISPETSPAASPTSCPQLSGADGATGTPSATPQPGLACARGAVPAELSIPSIKVQATIEVGEMVNGEMQEPSTPKITTWYKETNRLGETGNIVIAGHLNYWGVPEGVFFNLGKLKAGDQIALTGEDGKTYTYVVTKVASLPIDEGPEQAIAPTKQQTLTLMTCGGDWDSSISEYDARTVVTAVRVDDNTP